MKTNRLKSMTLAAIAALSFAAPIALTSNANAEPPRHEQNYNNHDNHNDHRDWRRGDRPSTSDRQHFRNVDYRQQHFRTPPRGYHYVRDDRSGQYLLVGVATGVILSVIASH